MRREIVLPPRQFPFRTRQSQIEFVGNSKPIALSKNPRRGKHLRSSLEALMISGLRMPSCQATEKASETPVESQPVHN